VNIFILEVCERVRCCWLKSLWSNIQFVLSQQVLLPQQSPSESSIVRH
jgi:hypothetical protein